MIKNLPAMWETQVQSLGWEDPLAYSSILTWEISEEPGGYSHEVTKSRTRLSFGGLFIYLAALHRMQGQVPQLNIDPKPPAMEEWSLVH